MKQADAKTMAIKINGLDKFEDLESVRVIFKQEKDSAAAIKKEAIYMADGSGDAELISGVLLIKWSIEDTFLFEKEKYFYADYQIKLSGSDEMPSIPISQIYMSESLFTEQEAGRA